MEPSTCHPIAPPLRGFTIAEMVVVAFISALISAVAIVGQRSYEKTILVTDTAYTVALSLREAQSYGLSSRKFSTINNAGYGIQFLDTTPASYILFADINPAVAAGSAPDVKPGNSLYNSASELLRTYSLNRNYTIKDFCGNDSSNTKRCASTGYLDSLHVVFRRPNSDTSIIGVRSTGASVVLKDAAIHIASPDGLGVRCVTVSTAGQIAVPQTCP